MRVPALLLTLLMLAAPVAAQPVVYVRAGATGANNGTSWANAYRELRTALAAVVPPAEVWVAAGTYKPTAGTDRTATFQLRSGVALYGGFAGTEATRGERDWTTNMTTLSGEIGSATSISDNACHVVTAAGVDSTAVLDGFVLAHGNAQACAWGGGGGLLIEAVANPHVRNCEVRQNNRVGVYVREGARPRIADCVIAGNASIRGGGMFNRAADPVLERVAFRANAATDGGGAMASFDGARPVCIDCAFEENTATSGNGGAVYNDASAPLFVRATFVGNTSTSGGGAVWIVGAGADMICVRCLFRANASALGAGGAVYAREARPAFVGTVFEGNAAAGRGGAFFSDGGSEPVFVNVAFVGNRARSGGAATFANGAPRLINVTVGGNRAQTGGGALEVGGGTATLLNAVVWGNALLDGSPSGVLHAAGGVTVRHGLLQGGCAPPLACEAVVDADPLFVRAPEWAGGTLVDAGDLRLRAGSPAIDAGSLAHLPADVWDLDGDGDTEEPLPVDVVWMPRVQGASVDLGAYEGDVVVTAEPEPGPAALALAVAPNPSRGAAMVTLTLAEGGAVRVAVYDVLGRAVAGLHAGPLAAGTHAFAFDAPALPAGVYVVRAEAGAGTAARRLVVAR